MSETLRAGAGVQAAESPGPIDQPPAESSPRRGGDLSQWQLIRRHFARHKLAVGALHVLVLMYLVAVFAEFVAPMVPNEQNLDYQFCPPQQIKWSFSDGLYVNAKQVRIDPVTFRRSYHTLSDLKVPLSFFVKGGEYRMWGLIPMRTHLFGVDESELSEAWQDQAGVAPTFYLFGADEYGRGILSRAIYGARVSLSVGLIGITMTFILGMIIGGVSGYIGGRTDNVIQRAIEVINAFPQLPLWLALGAVMPADWSPLTVYFAITIVLSLLAWTGLARVVRGKILSLREEDYAMAARLLGASHSRVLFRHLIPGFASHIIVALSLAVPTMILAETSLSFLGLGLRAPIVSWGVMLQDCMDIQAVRYYPWLLIPVGFIVSAVLCFNFVGDGLRDAADPYATN